MWVLKACASGLIGYVFPRLLVALGVPVDSWIVAMASWLSIRISSDVALWLASFIVFVALYGFALWYLRSDVDRPRRNAVGVGPWIVVIGIMIALVGGAIWFFEIKASDSAVKTVDEIRREAQERHRSDPTDNAFDKDFMRKGSETKRSFDVTTQRLFVRLLKERLPENGWAEIKYVAIQLRPFAQRLDALFRSAGWETNLTRFQYRLIRFETLRA